MLYPGDFTGDAPAFDDWTSGTGGVILEAMQPVMESRWLEMERSKGQISDWDVLRSQGEAESRILGLFLDAADRANRWDLSRFLLAVMSKVLTPDLALTFWTGGLQGSGPARMVDRLETQRSALALIRCGERLAAMGAAGADERIHGRRLRRQQVLAWRMGTPERWAKYRPRRADRAIAGTIANGMIVVARLGWRGRSTRQASHLCARIWRAGSVSDRRKTCERAFFRSMTLRRAFEVLIEQLPRFAAITHE